ncbi:MAG TPA: hypothetical protein VMB80_12170 [Candidatus Acidoferrum sp.]|nr:hypothetical protein [Candidatus Acidoferrum sp.]
MTDDNAHHDAAPLEALRRYVPLAVWAIVILAILAIPLRIISYGYLPADDALRHAAKAVSGKPWPEILVVGPGFQIDHNYGWHLVLQQVHLWGKCDTEGLVVFSVVVLFVLAGWSALPWLRRPEAWLVTLTAAALASDITGRFSLGRPFLLTIAGLFTILFCWKAHGASPPRWRTVVGMALLIAVCSFVHGVWYLWTLPVAAFCLAGQFRWAAALTVSWLAGIVAGATLTGHPLAALYQAVEMAQRAFAMHTTQRTMVTEFQPSTGAIFALVILGGLVILRQLARLPARPLTADPVFWLAAMGWVLSFKAGRFMEDWGWPALMVLTTCDLQLLLEARFAADSLKRLALTAGLALMTFLAITNDANSRWTWNLTLQYLDPKEHPDELTGWMPEKGGILYTGDMTIFYQTFFKNPHGDWRYILGYEPAFMPDEDFQVYHKILWNFGDAKAYQPWVDKMRPEDRLVIRGGRGSPPNLPQLEWEYAVSGIWVGRTPRTNAPPPAPTLPAEAPAGKSTNTVNSAQ